MRHLSVCHAPNLRTRGIVADLSAQESVCSSSHMRNPPLHSRPRVLDALIAELRSPDTQLSTQEREALRAQAEVLMGLLTPG
eukprot:5679326-Prymnesium_polylepis.1